MNIKEQARSITQKLVNLAQKKGVAHPLVVTEFLIERLLARIISNQKLQTSLIFKGGYVGLYRIKEKKESWCPGEESQGPENAQQQTATNTNKTLKLFITINRPYCPFLPALFNFWGFWSRFGPEFYLSSLPFSNRFLVRPKC
ncbi:MAG: hypothetical protein HYV97_02780 [Bdellovibrio sp.]|nr:hypothetical protein [Bdellovibrio sp.]